MGGTWDLFNYPGIRSDSDMYTFGFAFRSWDDDSAIAEKNKIISYLQATVEEFDLHRHIQYDTKITRVGRPRVRAGYCLRKAASNSPATLFMCVPVTTIMNKAMHRILMA